MRFAEMMERRLRGWLPGSRFSEWNRAQTAAFFGVAPALAFRPHEWPPGRAVARYRAHAAAVAACVPPGRLLVFNVKEGWAPLVAFLQRSGVPCTPPPEGTPFPRLNERRSLSYCGIVRTLLASALAERPALGRAALALALAAGMAACARAVAAGGGGV